MKKVASIFILFFLLISVSSIEVQARDNFTDLGSVSWAEDEIYFLNDRGIINGYGNGIFAPNEKITRGQAALMLVRELYPNEISNTELTFSDVDKNEYYYNAIAVAVDHELFSGYSDNTFRPQNPITRAENAKILSLAYDLKGENANFNDLHEAAWAKDYINALASNNITNGYADNTFRPNNSISRAEFSVSFARVLDPSFRITPTIPKVVWDGKWTNEFGDVAISNETSNSFDFDINVVMGGHVGEINGTASIQGETAVYSEYIETFEGVFDDPYCSITFTHSGDSIKVNETVACLNYHGMAATFDGTYSATTENQIKPEMIDELVVTINYRNNSVLVNGISLGTSREDVVNTLGNPKRLGYDEYTPGHYSVYLLKDRISNQELELHVYFYNNKVSDIIFDINENIINTNWYKDLGSPFSESWGTTYYYLEGTEHVLMFKPNEGHGYVGYADNNFYDAFGMGDKIY